MIAGWWHVSQRNSQKLRQVSFSPEAGRGWCQRQTKTRQPANKQLFILPSCQPLAITILLSVSRNLTTPSPSHKWNHILVVILRLASFAQYNVLEFHPCCSVSKFPSFVSLNNTPLCVHIILFIHSSVNRHLICFLFGYCE